MTYYDEYMSRLNATKNSLIDSTVNLIGSSFKDAPNYKIVKINNSDIESRFNYDKDYIGTLLFKPNTIFSLGEYVEIDNKVWIITDFNLNYIYPKATVYMCNEAIKWKDKDGIVHSYPCAILNWYFYNPEEFHQLVFVRTEIHVLIKNDDFVKTLYPSQRFILGSQVYQLLGINDISKKDICQLRLDITLKKPEDDFENGIADNTTNQGGNPLW